MQKTSWLQETLSENQSTSSKQEAHLLFIQLSIYLSKWVVLRLTVSCSFELSSSSLQLKCLIFELDNFNCNDSFAFTNCVALEKLYNFSRPTFIFLLQGFILSVRKVVDRCWEAARDKEKEIYHQLVVFQNGFNNLNYIREKPGSWNSTWVYHICAGGQLLGSASTCFPNILQGSGPKSLEFNLGSGGSLTFNAGLNVCPSVFILSESNSFKTYRKVITNGY